MKKSFQSSLNKIAAPLLFLLPNLLIFGIFIILPALSGLRLAFYQWSILGESHFIGFKNFVELFSDEMFWITFFNTLRYVLLVVPILIISSLGMALLTTETHRGIALFRGIYYLPTMLSLIIVGIIWRWILGDELGIVNYMLCSLGRPAVQWLTTGFTANLSLVFITIWTFTGFYMVMFISGLQAIPEDIYAAASIDGASKVQVFWRITLPLINPTMLVVLVLGTINAFKAFELIYTLTKGGPGNATKFLVQYTYQVAFEEDRLGYASAMAIMIMLLIACLTFFQFKLNRRGEYTNE